MVDLTRLLSEFLGAKRARGENLDHGRLLNEIDRSFGHLINGAQWGQVQRTVQSFLQGGPPSTHIVRHEERRSQEGGTSSTGHGGARERVFSQGGTSSAQGGEGGEEEEEDGDLEAATGEMFCSYNPGLTAVGNAHPDLVDESATLASIKQPECQYKLGLPREVVLRRLSNLQLETIQMACERFGGFLPDGSRQGFYLGDGAGMGKGRQIGGLVYELLLRGHKKALWFSASAGLHYDAERDIGDLGALKYIQLHRLDQYNYGELPMTSGVLFSTYSMLISTSGSDGTSRLDQITRWLGDDFEGLICFDEAHKAKHGEHMNAKGEMVTGTLTAAAVLELQRRLPKARIVYVSATAATEPQHLAYMPRLGLWGQGASLKDFPALLKMCTQGGVGAMEILCMEMKMRGMFLSRTLSYRHPETPAEFEICRLDLTPGQEAMYKQGVAFFQRMLPLLEGQLEAVKASKFPEKRCKPYYWGAHQRLFKMLCIAFKTGPIVELVQQLISGGAQVVMSLQGTGEAYQERTELRAVGGSEETMDEAPKALLASTVMYLFPPISKDSVDQAREEMPDLFELRRELLEEVAQMTMPDNPLDDLKFRLGGPEKVAELTGRKQMLVTEDGKKVFQGRDQYLGCPADEVNLRERDTFQKGQKRICIISDAASSGISLQADRNCPPDPTTGRVRRRHHITLEVPWSADKCVQQLGRSHRSNQVSAPYYHLMISSIAGENRFASAVAKRLQSLGALTNGDRRSKVSNMAEFDLDNQYGVNGLKEMLTVLTGEVTVWKEKLKYPDPAIMRDLFAFEGVEDLSDADVLELTYAVVKEMQVDLCAVELLKKKKVPVPRFLNRILGIAPKRQNRLFKFFELHVEAEIAKARKNGTFVEAIGQMGKDYQSVRIVEGPKVVYTHPQNRAETSYYRFQMDKGADWKKAVAHLREEPGFFNGFWRSKNPANQTREHTLLLATEHPAGSGAARLALGARGRVVRDGKSRIRFRLMRPNNAHAYGQNLEQLQDKYDFVRHFDTDEDVRRSVQKEWDRAYKHAATARGSMGRLEEAHFLAGSLTCIWPLVQEVTKKGKKKQLKICRIEETKEDGRQVIGLHIRGSDDKDDILHRLDTNDFPTDLDGAAEAPEELTTGWEKLIAKKEADKKEKGGQGNYKPRGGGRNQAAKRKRRFERYQIPERPLEEDEIAQLEQSGKWEDLPLPPVVDPEAYEVPVSADATPAPVLLRKRTRGGAVLTLRKRGLQRGDPRGHAETSQSGALALIPEGAPDGTESTPPLADQSVPLGEEDIPHHGGARRLDKGKQKVNEEDAEQLGAADVDAEALNRRSAGGSEEALKRGGALSEKSQQPPVGRVVIDLDSESENDEEFERAVVASLATARDAYEKALQESQEFGFPAAFEAGESNCGVKGEPGVAPMRDLTPESSPKEKSANAPQSSKPGNVEAIRASASKPPAVDPSQLAQILAELTSSTRDAVAAALEGEPLPQQSCGADERTPQPRCPPSRSDEQLERTEERGVPPLPLQPVEEPVEGNESPSAAVENVLPRSGTSSKRAREESGQEPEGKKRARIQSDTIWKKVQSVHRRLTSDRQRSWLFAEPVDPVRLDIPTYHDVIKHPMDLGTAGRKLREGEYSDIDEYAADVRLTFRNGTTFNGPGNVVHEAAAFLLRRFEGEWWPPVVADVSSSAREVSRGGRAAPSGGQEGQAQQPPSERNPAELPAEMSGAEVQVPIATRMALYEGEENPTSITALGRTSSQNVTPAVPIPAAPSTPPLPPDPLGRFQRFGQADLARRNAIAKALQRTRNRGQQLGTVLKGAVKGPDKERESAEGGLQRSAKKRKGNKPLEDSGVKQSKSTVEDTLSNTSKGKERVAKSGTTKDESLSQSSSGARGLQIVPAVQSEAPIAALNPASLLQMMASMPRDAIRAIGDLFQAAAKLGP